MICARRLGESPTNGLEKFWMLMQMQKSRMANFRWAHQSILTVKYWQKNCEQLTSNQTIESRPTGARVRFCTFANV